MRAPGPVPATLDDMNLQRLFVAGGCAGAAAYTICKIDLAARGELGMPGFPAPADSYQQYDPVSGQISNALVGFGMLLLIGWLGWPPRRAWLRRGLLTVSWTGVALVASGLAGFTLRATDIVPRSGVGTTPVAWVTLAVGAAWVASWVVANLGAVQRKSIAEPRS